MDTLKNAESLKVHVIMPTRSRPVQAVQRLRALHEMAYRKNTTIEIVCDLDDPSVTPSWIRTCEGYGALITCGNHRNKVAAFNGFKHRDWDVVVATSDDMEPCVAGYDHVIASVMAQNFPSTDGAIHFHDVLRGADLCTLSVMGRRLFERFGFIYNPVYLSLYCDTEFTELTHAMRVLHYDRRVLFRHEHHSSGASAFDDLYRRNDAMGGVDADTYYRRLQTPVLHAQWPFGHKCWLSVLILSTHSRLGYLDRLLTKLHSITRPYGLEIEILTNIDGGEQTIGKKRQDLLMRAQGHYVVFMDDDDLVHDVYFDRIMPAITTMQYDVVGFRGIYTLDGQNPCVFEHSIKHDKWWDEQKDGRTIYYRCPNHLNPVRRELALKAGYPQVNRGEDRDYSYALRPLLKSEHMVEEPPLYYYLERSIK
jgi:hypothetical protein